MLLAAPTATINVSLDTAFGLPIKGKTVKGLDDPFNPAIPALKEYCFSMDVARPVLSFMEYPEDNALWLWGLHGTGKTSLIQQICARLNFACYSINGSETLEMEDLLYRLQVNKDGTTSTELNVLAQAFVFGGVCLFNEIDLCDPSRLAALNEILAGDTLIIPGIDQVFVKHENFRFVATANTNGSFDEVTGIDMAGTNTMNIAFLDRFIMVEVPYLNPEQELGLLSDYAESVMIRISGKVDTKLHKRLQPHVKSMIRVANESRKSAKDSGSFDRPISMRGLKRWVQKSIQYNGAPNPIKLALGEAVTNSYPKSQKEAIQRFCLDIFGESFS